MKNEKIIEAGKKLLEAGISLELEWQEDHPAIRHGMYSGDSGYYFRMKGRNNFSDESKKTTTDILNEYGFKVVDFSPFEIEWGGDRYYNASVSFIEKPEDLAVGSLKRLWDI